MLLILETDPIEPPNYNGGPLDDDYILLPLIHLYGKLHTIPEKYLKLITQIMVINRWVESATVTPKIVKKLGSFFIGTPRESKPLIKLFKEAIYLDLIEDYTPQVFDFLVTFSSKIFFDNTLTSISIDILTRTLACHETIGFRKTSNNSKDTWEQITDVDKYLNIAYALNIAPEWFKEEDNFGEEEIEEAFIANKAIYFNTISHVLDIKYLVIIKDDDKDLLLELIDFLNHTVGQYAIIECSHSDYNILPNKERLVIKSIDRLPSIKITELFSELTTGEYKDKPVLLHSSTPLNVDEFIDIFRLDFYSFEIFKEDLRRSKSRRNERFNIINSIASDLQKILVETCKTEKELKKRLLKLDDLKKVDHSFNPSKVNYWYDFNSIKYPDTIKYIEELNEAHSKYHNLNEKTSDFPNKTNIILTHNVKLNNWSISIDGKEAKRVSYQNSLGLKYLTYLVKYCRDDKTITDDILKKRVLDWHRKGSIPQNSKINSKKLSKPAAHSIEQALHYLFSKQCPELAITKRYLHITANTPGCWFETNMFLDIEVIDDQMPAKKD
jgi:hypothetical protein